jgi:hypothetical protein
MIKGFTSARVEKRDSGELIGRVFYRSERKRASGVGAAAR